MDEIDRSRSSLAQASPASRVRPARGYIAVELELFDLDVSLAAKGLLVALRADSHIRETDGRIAPRFVAAVAGACGVSGAELNRLLKELLEAGVLVLEGKDYVDVHHLVWNSSKEDRFKRREGDRIRQRRHREAGVTAPVTRDKPVTSHPGHAPHTDTDTETDTQTDTDTQTETQRTRSRPNAPPRRRGGGSVFPPTYRHDQDEEVWSDGGQWAEGFARHWDDPSAVLEHGLGRALSAEDQEIAEMILEEWCETDGRDESVLIDIVLAPKFLDAARRGDPVTSMAYLAKVMLGPDWKKRRTERRVLAQALSGPFDEVKRPRLQVAAR
jgi:hypothetical protein